MPARKDSPRLAPSGSFLNSTSGIVPGGVVVFQTFGEKQQLKPEKVGKKKNEQNFEKI